MVSEQVVNAICIDQICLKVLVFKISTHSAFEEPPILLHSFINMSRYSAYGLIFSYENFDSWKIRMQAFLAIMHDEMVDCDHNRTTRSYDGQS